MYRYLLLSCTMLFSLFAFGDDPYQSMDSEHYSRMEGGVITGESFDARRGDMSFEIPMISLPGSNGMGISVSVSFNKTTSLTGGPHKSGTSSIYFNDIFQGQIYGDNGGGGWVIEVPRLFGATGTDICGYTDVGPLLVLPGQSPIKFGTPDDGSPIKNVDYVAHGGWTAKCKKDSTGLILGLIVRSPRGLIYKFNLLPRVAISPLSTCALNYDSVIPNYPVISPSERSACFGGISMANEHVFTASSVEDIYGNWIHYEYSGLRLSKISSSDGQKVDIVWSSFSVSTPYATTIEVPTKITANSKSWLLNYQVCNPGTSCFQNPPPGALADNQSIILKGITRPDGKSYSFVYNLYLGQRDIERKLIRPGRHYQIIQITHPNGLNVDYTYRLMCTNYIDGMRPSLLKSYQPYFEGWLTEDVACSRYLSLASKTYSGPGLTTTKWTYSYFVPNFDSDWVTVMNQHFKNGDYNYADRGSGGDKVSYTFEFGPTKLKTSKFRRDPAAGDLSLIDSADDPATNMIIETGIFPLPPPGYESLPDPPPPPEPPPPPPAVVFTSTTTVFAVGSSITINFTSTTGFVSSTQCKIDNGSWLPCTTLTSLTIAGGLPAGPHTIQVRIYDLAGKIASTATYNIYVGDPNAPVAPNLVYDLVGSMVLPSQRVTLYAQFTGIISKYTWYKNGVAISGATESYLVIDPVTASSFGKYKVVAWNQSTSKSSTEVEVKLNAGALMSIINAVLLE